MYCKQLQLPKLETISSAVTYMYCKQLRFPKLETISSAVTCMYLKAATARSQKLEITYIAIVTAVVIVLVLLLT